MVAEVLRSCQLRVHSRTLTKNIEAPRPPGRAPACAPSGWLTRTRQEPLYSAGAMTPLVRPACMGHIAGCPPADRDGCRLTRSSPRRGPTPPDSSIVPVRDRPQEVLPGHVVMAEAAEVTALPGARELRTGTVRRWQRAGYPGNGETTCSPASALSRTAASSSRKKSVMAWPLCRTWKRRSPCSSSSMR